MPRLLHERPAIGDIMGIIGGFKLGIQGGEHQDRAAVLVCVSSLELALEDAIWSHSVPLAHNERKAFFGGKGVARTLADKIFLAYVLGVIGPKTRKDLDRVRDIRNDFAHAKRHVDFNTREIHASCVFRMSDADLWKRMTGRATMTAKEIFVQTVEIVVSDLLGIDDELKSEILR